MNADNFNFSEKGLEEIYKKVLVLFYNVGNFYNMYKEEDDLNYEKSDELMDKWIISLTEELVKNVKKYLVEYNTVKACSEIREYVDSLSTWYVRNSRDRFNEGDSKARKTLRYVLEKIVRVLAPILPFASEKIYQDMNGKEKSVHLEDWPESGLINPSVSEKMELIRSQVSEALRQRDQNKVPLKWPLAKAKISDNDYSEGFIEIFKKEVNVKKVEFLKEASSNLDVKLDFEMTPELEAEGYARELSRKVQAFRKKLGLNKDDEIELDIVCDEKLMKILKNWKEFLKERTNSKNLKFEEKTDDGVGEKQEFKIKNNSGFIFINLN